MYYLARLLLLVQMLALATVAVAQERPESYPSRSVKIVVPFPAGGPTDILSRVVAQRLSVRPKTC